jgi:glutamate/tyrosine decarboxylase-like PLP-dependent enzyme
MEAVTAALNQSAAVFEMSPVGTVIEHRVVSWMCELAGFATEHGAGGTLTTGRHRSDVHGVAGRARETAVPEAWSNGGR